MTFEEREQQRNYMGKLLDIASRAGGDRAQQHPSTMHFLSIMDELKELHRKKGKDYGSDTDPFANVSSSADFAIDPWKAAMVRANDKMKRIQRYACTGTLANEGVIDSFNDLAVYAVIARVLFERGMKS